MSTNSTTNVMRPRNLGFLAALALTAVVGIADATPLPPGGWVDPSANNLASDPTLAGTTIAAKNLPFACGTFSGVLRMSVVKNTLGLLDFYYTVTNDPTSTSSIVELTTRNYAVSPASLDVEWRNDIPGNVPGYTVSRDPSGIQLTWAFYPGAPVAPGLITYPLLARSQRPAFDAVGVATVSDGTTTCGISGTFEPR